MSLKQQLKILQDRKEYAAMIALLEASNEPNRDTIIARIRQRINEEARAEVVLKATDEPVKGNPQLRATIVLGLVSVGIFAALALWIVIQRPTAEAQIGVSFYCGIYQDRDNCPDYAKQVMAQYEPTVMACYWKHEYPKYDGSYYRCLQDAGI